MANFKAVVTDYIEPDLVYEAQKLAELGIDFEAFQLKFRPEDEVYEAIKDADVIVVNMVKMPESLISRLTKCKLIIRQVSFSLKFIKNLLLIRIRSNVHCVHFRII